jgi:hypothetical protein
MIETSNEHVDLRSIDRDSKISMSIGSRFAQLCWVLEWSLIGRNHMPSLNSSSRNSITRLIDYVATNRPSDGSGTHQRQSSDRHNG